MRFNPALSPGSRRICACVFLKDGILSHDYVPVHQELLQTGSGLVVLCFSRRVALNFGDLKTVLAWRLTDSFRHQKTHFCFHPQPRVIFDLSSFIFAA